MEVLALRGLLLDLLNKLNSQVNNANIMMIRSEIYDLVKETRKSMNSIDEVFNG